MYYLPAAPVRCSCRTGGSLWNSDEETPRSLWQRGREMAFHPYYYWSVFSESEHTHAYIIENCEQSLNKYVSFKILHKQQTI